MLRRISWGTCGLLVCVLLTSTAFSEDRLPPRYPNGARAEGSYFEHHRPYQEPHGWTGSYEHPFRWDVDGHLYFNFHYHCPYGEQCYQCRNECEPFHFIRPAPHPAHEHHDSHGHSHHHAAQSLDSRSGVGHTAKSTVTNPGNAARGEITLRLAADATATSPVEFEVDGRRDTLRAGESRTFAYDQPKAIRLLPTTGSKISRSYALVAGEFKFVVRDGGWDLVRAAPSAASATAPTGKPLASTR